MTVFVFLAVLLYFGCAKVQIQAPKEPIKVDISMRLDIYQHVQKDIDAIEDLVSGAAKPQPPRGNGSSLFSYIKEAHAQEGLSPEVEQSALRRRDRREQLLRWQVSGVIGESRSGLVEIRRFDTGDYTLGDLVNAENNDRMIIYHALAAKNNTSVEEIQQAYTMRLQQDAPAGTPIEIFDNTSGGYEWRIK
jgi:uncharacterized protein YdbL (DUF1318 family)